MRYQISESRIQFPQLGRRAPGGAGVVRWERRRGCAPGEGAGVARRGRGRRRGGVHREGAGAARRGRGRRRGGAPGTGRRRGGAWGKEHGEFLSSGVCVEDKVGGTRMGHVASIGAGGRNRCDPPVVG
jgi:hypothetical protein